MPRRDWKRDPLTAGYLRDSGLLFEVNRTVLHLFGIALTVCEDEEGNSWLELQDARDDPEGFIFPEELYKQGEAKLQKFMKEHGYQYLGERQRRIGVGCQNRPEVSRNGKQKN